MGTHFFIVWGRNCLDHDLWNCGTRTIPGMQAIVYRYAVLIKNRNIKNVYFFRKISKKHKLHIFRITRHCWPHCVTYLRCLPSFQFQHFLFEYKKIIGGVWKLFQLVVRRRKSMRTFDVGEFTGLDWTIYHLPVSIFCNIVNGVFEMLSFKYQYSKRHV